MMSTTTTDRIEKQILLRASRGGSEGERGRLGRADEGDPALSGPKPVMSYPGRSGLKSSAPVFAALGDATRLKLVARLSEGGPQSIKRLTRRSSRTRQAI